MHVEKSMIIISYFYASLPWVRFGLRWVNVVNVVKVVDALSVQFFKSTCKFFKSNHAKILTSALVANVGS